MAYYDGVKVPEEKAAILRELEFAKAKLKHYETRFAQAGYSHGKCMVLFSLQPKSYYLEQVKKAEAKLAKYEALEQLKMAEAEIRSYSS